MLSKRNVQREFRDVTEPGNSALNDMANAALLEFFTSTDVGEDIEENKNGTTGGNG